MKNSLSVPEGWDKCLLCEALTLSRGFDLPSRLRADGKIPIVSSSGITGFHATHAIEQTTLVTGRYGTIGEVFYVDEPSWPLNTTLYVNSFKKVSPKFGYFLLKTVDFHAHSGKSGVPGVNRNDVHQEIVLIPSKKEQTAIANALSDVDALIAGLEKLIAKKQAIKTATMQQLLTGRTRLPQFATHPDGTPKDYKQTELGEIPEDWDLQTINGLNFDISDGNYSSKYPRADEFKQIGIPFIRANNIKSLTVINDDMRFISPEKHNEITKGHLKKGDVLITNRGEIGNLALVPERFIGANINAQIVRINTKGTVVTNKYFAYFLQKKEVTQALQDLQTGSALKQLPVNRLKTLSVVIPSKKEQTAIATILSDMDKEIQALQQRLDKTRQLKQGMMQELLTGKTRLIKREAVA